MGIRPVLASVRSMAGPMGQGKAAGGVADWWLSGGIEAGNVVAAYQPLGAASYAASLVNLASPGTRDAAVLTGAPDWNASDGWVGQAGCSGLTVSNYLTACFAPWRSRYTVVVRTVNIPNWNRVVTTTTGNNQLNIGVGSAPAHGYAVGGNTLGAVAYTGVSGTFVLTQETDTGSEGYFDGNLDVDDPIPNNAVIENTGLKCGPYTQTSFSVQAVGWFEQYLEADAALELLAAVAAL